VKLLSSIQRRVGLFDFGARIAGTGRSAPALSVEKDDEAVMLKKTKKQEAENNHLAQWGASQAVLDAWSAMPRRRDSELAEILNHACDEIESAVRRSVDNGTHPFCSDILDELRELNSLVAERLREIESRYAPVLLYGDDSRQKLSDEEREALTQQSYERFLRENPGKAHFTREQWEKAR
jgi:hypothetical protein